MGSSIFTTDFDSQVPAQANVKIEEIKQPLGKSQMDLPKIIPSIQTEEIEKKENPTTSKLSEIQIKSETPSIIKPSNNKENEKGIKSSKGYIQLLLMLLIGMALIGVIYYYYIKPKSTNRGDGHHKELKSMGFKERDDFKNL